MKEIILRSGEVAVVDDDIYENVMSASWHLKSDGYVGRSVREGSKVKTVYLHHVAFGAVRLLDHRDRNKLNNQRENLRPATTSQNIGNAEFSRAGKSSRFRGVTWSKQTGRWRAKIGMRIDGKLVTKNLGEFDDEKNAAAAYAEAARNRFGSDYFRI